jgi:hypothetical protein
MLTLAPLPSWLNLCRAILQHPPTDINLAAPWCREGEIAGWLSRSAWSLALIALWRKSQAPALPVTIWIPEFFCNESLTVLRKIDAKLVFYPVTVSMTPEIATCRVLADTAPPDLFVLVHYFGRPTPLAAARDFCAHHGAWLIEDAAHVLRPVRSVGAYGDFVLYSPHKHLPIPDGAVLVARTNGPGQFGADGLTSFGSPSNWPSQLHELQKELGRSVSSSRVNAVVWLAKRVLQKLGINVWYRSRMPFAESLNSGSSALIKIAAPHQTSLSRRLMSSLLADLGAVARERQRRQLLWDALLLDNVAYCSESVSAAERSVSREWTPYLNAYSVSPETAKVIHNQWQHHGLPVSTWPDLPPEVAGLSERETTALLLRHGQLYLPVHQTLSLSRMMALGLSQIRVEEDEASLVLRWDSATRVQWQLWMEQSGRTNLLQSWAYGEAKSNLSGWRVRRGVFYLNNEPIAIVQILQKRVAGLLSITRINRGPLFLRVLLPLERRAVFKKLASLGSLWQGRVLNVAPEQVLSGSSLVLMEDIGLRQFSPQSFESIWVDLRLNLDVLHKKLDGKWRNMLTVSKKNKFKLEIGCDDDLFNWMMNKYQELMQEKNFNGPPISLIQALRKHLGSDDQLIILRAVHDGEPVAGICLVEHGCTATYLLGWNGCKGRNLKANYYLLWSAITHLKQLGMLWFDLGGICEEKTPGVTAFKRGLNGKHYELVGEYWKW